MQEAFRIGGWGMFPTLFVGCVLVIAAGRYALVPARGRMPVVIGLGVLTLLVSWLGFVTGVIKTMTSAGALDNTCRSGGMVVTGIGESLVNVGFGLAIVIVAGIGVVVGLGRARGTSSGASQLVDPLGG